MLGRFFFSSQFNKDRNTLRANKGNEAGFNFNIKLVPLSEMWFFECTTRKEDLFEDNAPLKFNQMYCFDTERYYDIIHAKETAKCIVWTLRERVSDGIVWEYIGNKAMTIKRCSHNIVPEAFDMSRTALYDMPLLNAEAVVPYSIKQKPPIIVYCYWTTGDNVPERFGSVVVADNDSSASDNYVCGLGNTACLLAFGLYDPETKEVRKGFKVNGVDTATTQEIEAAFRSVNIPSQITNTTMFLWYDYSGDVTNGITLLNSVGVVDIASLYEARPDPFVHILKATCLKHSVNVNDTVELVTTDPHATLTLNVFGQSCTVQQEPNSNLPQPKLYIIQNVLPQCTSYNVFCERTTNNVTDTSQTITKLVLSFEITGGIIRDVTSYEQYNLDNPSSYALSVKMPMQAQEFQYKQAVNDAMFNGFMGFGSGALNAGMGNYVGGGMQMATSGLTTAYNIGKARETSGFNKQQILDKYRYEMENIKAQKGNVTPTTNMFMLVLCGQQPVSFFTVDYVCPPVREVLRTYYLRFGYNWNIRGTMPTSTTIPELYIETQNSLYDIGIEGGITHNDERIVELCEQLDRGVLIIDNK